MAANAANWTFGFNERTPVLHSRFCLPLDEDEIMRPAEYGLVVIATPELSSLLARHYNSVRGYVCIQLPGDRYAYDVQGVTEVASGRLHCRDQIFQFRQT